MEIERSSPNTPRKAIEKLSIKDNPSNKKNTKQQQMHFSLTVNITPLQYRGMHLLGNFRSSRTWNPRQDSELRDHRLSALPPSLFLNRTILDVGCGQGKASIEIAMRFFPKHITALDIDAHLLEKTTKLIDKIVSRNSLYEGRQEVITKKVKELPLYFQQQFQANFDKVHSKVEIMTEGTQFESHFPGNISVYNQNFMNITTEKRYETILILGTSKWVHLALGDKGLIALFEKACDLLEDKGILIIEYPLYRSYQKKKSMNSLYSYNMQNTITIDPITFPSILSHMGLEILQQMTSKSDRPLKHPLVVLRKRVQEQEK